MLNLSQNRICTIQGLESMPALVALNLGESVCALSFFFLFSHWSDWIRGVWETCLAYPLRFLSEGVGS